MPLRTGGLTFVWMKELRFSIRISIIILSKGNILADSRARRVDGKDRLPIIILYYSKVLGFT